LPRRSAAKAGAETSGNVAIDLRTLEGCQNSATPRVKGDFGLFPRAPSTSWTESNPTSRRKGDPRKVRIAAHLRRETTMTLEWIATRLHMGPGTYLAHLLSHRQPKDLDETNCTKTLF
jgi:hypothetical protein